MYEQLGEEGLKFCGQLKSQFSIKSLGLFKSILGDLGDGEGRGGEFI